jgi:hypothetical protein
MLKTIAMIDCDICGATFEKIAVFSVDNLNDWTTAISDLEHTAENLGWFYYHQEHRCIACLHDDFYKHAQNK